MLSNACVGDHLLLRVALLASALPATTYSLFLPSLNSHKSENLLMFDFCLSECLGVSECIPLATSPTAITTMMLFLDLPLPVPSFRMPSPGSPYSRPLKVFQQQSSPALHQLLAIPLVPGRHRHHYVVPKRLFHLFCATCPTSALAYHANTPDSIHLNSFLSF